MPNVNELRKIVNKCVVKFADMPEQLKAQVDVLTRQINKEHLKIRQEHTRRERELNRWFDKMSNSPHIKTLIRQKDKIIRKRTTMINTRRKKFHDAREEINIELTLNGATPKAIKLIKAFYKKYGPK